MCTRPPPKGPNNWISCSVPLRFQINEALSLRAPARTASRPLRSQSTNAANCCCRCCHKDLGVSATGVESTAICVQAVRGNTKKATNQCGFTERVYEWSPARPGSLRHPRVLVQDPIRRGLPRSGPAPIMPRLDARQFRDPNVTRTPSLSCQLPAP